MPVNPARQEYVFRRAPNLCRGKLCCAGSGIPIFDSKGSGGGERQLIFYICKYLTINYAIGLNYCRER